MFQFTLMLARFSSKLINKSCFQGREQPVTKKPFSRPWQSEHGAAAAGALPAPAQTTGLKAIASGGITGGIEICITYPTEYVKTQLQLDQRGETKKYSGIFDCVRKTVKEHGFRGLYRGLSVLLLGSIPNTAIRFGVFEQVKVMMLKKDGTLSTVGKLTSGLSAGVCEAFLVVTPMETVKVKFINDMRREKPRFMGIFHGVRTIVREEGLGGIYRGMPATVMRQGSNQAMRFFVVESLRDWYKVGDRDKPVPKLLVGMFGSIAGASSVFCNTPIDVVKTRMQGLEAEKYKNTLDCFVKIWQKEGPLAFYKGTVPRLISSAFDVAITFTIYDTVLDVLNFIWK